ncbi:ubiquinol cytochrome-c reductase subunit 9, putative [Aspergillus udagawae]|uniref:Complex III subunit 9 n=1 Tax=Aspergillus udagawae TaxID=91492 RepID=A0A8H3RGJ8_9EURO|nr:ubiquinol cytochrome-c reductase subunit 9, putative [Aspergillus udagawae]
MASAVSTAEVESYMVNAQLANSGPGLIRRNAVYLTTIFAGAFAFEMAFDTASNKIWDTMNRGRQWKDIKYRYMNKEEEEEE